jgi:zinc transporter 1/2/3
MEAAIACHSLIIGFGLGTSGGSELFVLTIALAFHQFFEGLALGMAAVESGMGKKGRLGLVLLFSVSVPLGAFVGMSAASSRAAIGEDGSNVREVVLQGMPNAVCAGMLAHIGVEMLNADFLAHSRSSWETMRKLALLALGALFMIVLSIWA